MSELTKSLESATRKRIDNWLKELGWNIDEESPFCNCFTERAKTEELIQIFRWANDLLRKEGLRNLDRFVEFANILFIKIMSEIETMRESTGEGRRLDASFCWESFSNMRDAKQMLNYINNSVLKNGFADKYNRSDDIFQKTLKITNPETIKAIVNRLSLLTLLNTESEIKGDAFEYFLKELASGNDLGEYFTPRHIVKLMTNIVNPKYGQTVYDPCCGTGGFLIEAFRHIKRSCDTDHKEIMKKLTENTIYGVELTDTYKIAKMNMIIIGDGHNNIVQGDSLAPKAKRDNSCEVILTNPPYSQQTDFGEHFPIPAKQADPIFLQHIILSLKKGGSAAVIVPEGLLFRGGVFEQVRKYLLENCDLKTIISLPLGVFLPYTDVKTDVIVFEKGKPTKKVWFYEISNDGFELNKNRRPIKGSDIPDLLEKWEEKPESEKSWWVDIAKIEKQGFSLKPDDYKAHKEVKSKYLLVRLEDIAEISAGSTASQNRSHYENGKYPFIRVKDLAFPENWKFVVKTRDKVNDLAVQEKRLNKVKKNSVIFPKSGISLLHNKRAILSEDCYVVNHFAILEPKVEKIDCQYLYYVLKKIDMGRYCNRTTLPSLNLSVIKEIKIPLPTLDEQKMIVLEIVKREKKVKESVEKANLYKEEIQGTLDRLFEK